MGPVKRLKKDKVKRGRIILSAVLTMITSLISLGFGAYLGYVTLNVNYITIGTMTPAVGGLLVCAGFFIFFGCVGGVISLKEIFISSRNEEKFSAYKPALISAMVYYVVIAIISVVGIVVALISFLPSNFTWSITGLAIVTLLLCAGSFYLVLKEMKEHKKKSSEKKQENQNEFANLNLSAKDIHEFSNASSTEPFLPNTTNVSEDSQKSNDKSKAISSKDDDDIFSKQQLYKKYMENRQVEKEIDFVSLAEKLMQLEELKKAGLINEQEYQTLKARCIN